VAALQCCGALQMVRCHVLCGALQRVVWCAASVLCQIIPQILTPIFESSSQDPQVVPFVSLVLILVAMKIAHAIKERDSLSTGF
jgi:hypothetical protein